jgi:hypothetical protein
LVSLEYEDRDRNGKTDKTNVGANRISRIRQTTQRERDPEQPKHSKDDVPPCAEIVTPKVRRRRDDEPSAQDQNYRRDDVRHVFLRA